MKLCRHCRFYRRTWLERLFFLFDRGACTHPSARSNTKNYLLEKYITGREPSWQELYSHPLMQRVDVSDDRCGPDGRFWQAR